MADGRRLALEHAERVAGLARAVALRLGWSPERADALYAAALVHDSGLAEEIWTKTWPLTHAEWEVVHQHPEAGAALAEMTLGSEEAVWVRHHHERIDGAGYPTGLAGDQIPEGSRIISLAEAFDAMTARLGSGPEATAQALAECRSCAGTQFWPIAVDALEEVLGADLPRMVPLEPGPEASWSPPAGAH